MPLVFVSELDSGVVVFDVDLRVKINPAKQPSTTLCARVSFLIVCRTFAQDDPFNDCVIVLKNKRAKRCGVRSGITSVKPKSSDLLECFFVLPLGRISHCVCATGLPVLGMWKTSMSTSQRSSAEIPSIRNPAYEDMTSDSVELCETAVCFLHIQLIGTNV